MDVESLIIIITVLSFGNLIQSFLIWISLSGQLAECRFKLIDLQDRETLRHINPLESTAPTAHGEGVKDGR